MTNVTQLLGADADKLLGFANPKIPASSLHLPGPDFIDRGFAATDRKPMVLRNLQALFNSGRLAGSGYVSILPVDQGIEHSAGASFAPNPLYFDPENIVRLAIEGGCNAVASTLGVLGSVSRRYAHRIPFILKFNHNELLTYPNKFDQVFFAHIRQCWDMGAAAVGATIYFGSDQSGRQIVEVAKAFVEPAGKSTSSTREADELPGRESALAYGPAFPAYANCGFPELSHETSWSTEPPRGSSSQRFS